jgi:hypothetical protein
MSASLIRRLALLAALLIAAAPAHAADLAANEALNSIHRIGGDARQLRFEGESATRVWPLYATMAESSGRARLHIAYTNAISVMPEASNIVVSVNDVAVVRSPIAAGGDVAALDVELPKGLLKPGYNAVRIAVSQRHRVDCSLEATYELWTQVDLASSGLTFPGQADPSIVSLDDLPAISPDPNGANVIHAVTGHAATLQDLDALMLGAEYVAIRGGFARPEVEVDETIGDKPGLYLVVGDAESLLQRGLDSVARLGSGISFTGSDVAGRTVVVVNGPDDAGVRETLAALAPPGWDQSRRSTAAGERALVNAGGFRAAGDSRIVLRDLGVDSEDFSGRMYRAGFDIVLPPDFYPADYDKMSLLIDASYAAGLGAGSQILVRVNDKEAGSLPLRNPRGDTLRARQVTVSLSALRPGFNHIVIEAQTPTDADKVCAVDATLAADKRFSLYETTEIVIPRIARIARLPDLAVTTASGFPYERAEPATLFVANKRPLTLGAAATLLARVAVAARRPMHMRLSDDVNDLMKGSALLFGADGAGAYGLSDRFRLDIPTMKAAWAHAGDAADAADAVSGNQPDNGAKPSGNGEQNFDQWADTPASLHPKLDFPAQLHAIYDRYINVHAEDFAVFRKGDDVFTPPPSATLVVAQAKGLAPGSTWSLVLAPDDEALSRGVDALVAPTAWSHVEGRAIGLNAKTGGVMTTASSAPYFIATASLQPANFRLIAAGWLSSDSDAYSALVLAMAVIFGAVTFAYVRSHGARP